MIKKAKEKTCTLLTEYRVKVRRMDVEDDMVEVIEKDGQELGVIVSIYPEGHLKKQVRDARAELELDAHIRLDDNLLKIGFLKEELEGVVTTDSLFERLKEKKAFCWGKDINEIYEKLVSITEKYGLGTGKQEFAVWSHVPQYGFRLTFTIYLTEDQMTDDFLKDLYEVVDFAKKRKVDLSPTNGMFWGKEKSGSMYVFSTFEDNERRKRKVA